MDDVANAIRDAWAKVRSRLDNDPAELRRRLARWPRMLAKYWPREWCYAIRAGDTRINEAIASIVPARYSHQEHKVTFDAESLRRLCGLVSIKSGTRRSRVGALLGRTVGNLVDGRLNGTFAVRHVPPTAYRGKPVPLLSSEKDLDPSAQGLRAPDALWGETAVARCPALRMDEPIIEQALRRVPHYVGRGMRAEDLTELHPEHPRRDPRPTVHKRLPPPAPDNAWYKWKGDEYIGYDWRQPWAKKAYERHERRKARQREAAKARYAEGKAPPRLQHGSLEFRGWRWICPNCQERVHTIYYRAPAVIAACIGKRFVRQLKAAAAKVKTVEGFACKRCHRIKHVGIAHPDVWNVVIAFLTGGLLYGSEVERPAWARNRRKKKYRPRINVRAPRRELVQKLLLAGLKVREIAAKLGVSYLVAQKHAHRIYAQHGVRGQGRIGLAKVLGVTLPAGTVVRRPGGGVRVIGDESDRCIAGRLTSAPRRHI